MDQDVARPFVDTARKLPATGEMAVLQDGAGLAVKRVEIIPGADPPGLRLISANPAYEPSSCLADEVHIVGPVPWSVPFRRDED